jgi:hypothetical protein
MCVCRDRHGLQRRCSVPSIVARLKLDCPSTDLSGRGSGNDVDVAAEGPRIRAHHLADADQDTVDLLAFPGRAQHRGEPGAGPGWINRLQPIDPGSSLPSEGEALINVLTYENIESAGQAFEHLQHYPVWPGVSTIRDAV